MNKKEFRIDLCIMLFILLLIATVMYLVDPLVQYKHKKIFKTFYSNERLLNPGLAMNEKYDSILLGSSMTRNFEVNDINKNLKMDIIKLPMMSGTPYDHKVIFDIANKNKNLRNVIYGLDLHVFNNNKNKPYIKLEEYLYKKNKFDDYQYLLNGEIIINVLPKVLISNLFKIKKDKLDKNIAYSWGKNDYSFSKKEVLKHYPSKILLKKINYDLMIENYNENLKKIITKNSKIKFYIFFPPYSILNFKLWEEEGILDDILKFKSFVSKDLTNYKNVYLFDFQIEMNIIDNLNNYMDLIHYSPEINKWMISKIKNKEYVVDINNYKNNINILEEEIKQFNL